MAVYLYRSPNIRADSKSLVEALNAKCLTRFDGLNFMYKGKPLAFNPEDVIICWGSLVPPIDGIKMFNASYETINSLQLMQNYNRLIARTGQIDRDIPIRIPELLWNPAAQGALADNTFFIDDPYNGTLVPRKKYPGYASVYNTMRHELLFHCYNRKIFLVEQKVAERPVAAGDVYKKNPIDHAHEWFRTEATGWKLEATTTYDKRYHGVVIKALTKADLSYGVVHLGVGEVKAYDGGYVTLLDIQLHTRLTEDRLPVYVKLFNSFIKE